MNSVKKNVKVKTMSILMAILTLLSCIPSIGHAITYGDTVELKTGAWMQGMYCDFVGYKTEITRGKYEQYRELKTGDGKPAYCAQLGTDFQATSNGKPQAEPLNLSDKQAEYVKAALLYGYQGSSKYGKSTTIEYCATQAIVWSIQLDSFNKDDENFLKHAFVTSGGHLNNCSVANANAAKEVYYKIKEQILNHYTIPSFATNFPKNSQNKNVVLKWNGSKYTASVKDSNGVLEHYNFKLNGVTFTKSGNTLTISTTGNLNKTTVSGERISNKYVNSLPVLSTGFVSQTNQETCFLGIKLSDPVQAYFSLTTESKGTCIIVKQDSETGKQIPLSGFGFKIKNVATGKYITVGGENIFYTNDEGEVTLSKNLEYGNYQLIEVNTAGEYVLDSTPIDFKISNGNPVTVVKKNVSQKGVINIFKQGSTFTTVTETNGMYQPVYSVKGLSDTTFEITAAENIVTGDGTVRYKKGQAVQTIKTNSEGVASSSPLYLGKYNVKETASKNGFVLDTKTYPVELKYAGQNVSVTSSDLTVTNERQKVEITLSKTMEKDELYGIGNNSEITKVVFGLYAAEPIVANDNKFIPKDGLIEKITLTASGTAKLSTDLPHGKYYIKEISTDEQYVLSEKKYDIDFSYTNVNTGLVKISVNEGKPIENEIIRGRIEGLKLDSDGFEVAGALIGLFRVDETEFTEKTALSTCISNEIGVFVFENVAYGNYVVREIIPPTGFVLNDTSYPVTIDKDSQTVAVKIENEFLTGEVEALKVDAENYENKLSGAVFEVYVDVDGNKEFNADIDKPVGEMSETEAGLYRMEGLRYNGYFVHEKIAPVGFIADENYYYFEIRNDGEIIRVTNIALDEEDTNDVDTKKYFVNKPIKGALEITKTDITTGKVLPNAGFRIKDEAGNIVAEGRTDENGIAKFTLRYGKYTYQEFDAPDGYQIDTKEYPFEVLEDGQIVKADMKNEPIPAPKTGANDETGANVAIILGSLAVIGGVIFFIIKRRKDGRE